MKIKCPKCETLFDYDNHKSSLLIQKFKCSVCNHLWEQKVVQKNIVHNKNNKSNYHLLIIINLLLLLLVVAAFIFFRKDLEVIDYYWKNIYLFFDALIPIQ